MTLKGELIRNHKEVIGLARLLYPDMSPFIPDISPSRLGIKEAGVLPNSVVVANIISSTISKDDQFLDRLRISLRQIVLEARRGLGDRLHMQRHAGFQNYVGCKVSADA